MSKPFKMLGHELPGPNQKGQKDSSPVRAFFGDLTKGKGKLGFLNPMGALASKVGGKAEKFLNPASMLLSDTDTDTKHEVEQELSGLKPNEKNELITNLATKTEENE